MSLLAGRRVVVVDVETTGISPAYGHRVVEVAAVTLENGEVRERWSSLVRPNRVIPADAVAVHGITDDMVAGAPAPEAVAADLRARVGGDAVAFHHAAFDLPFVIALMREAGLPRVLEPVIDTLGLARGVVDRGSHSLQALAERFQFPAEPRHRALGDALTAARLLQALAPRWERERSVRSLDQLAAASQDALRVPAATGPSSNAGAAGKTDFDTRRERPIMGDLFASANAPTGAQGESMHATVTVEPGQVAPDFKLRGPGGAPVTLSEYRGQKNVVLVFYPLAFSPVCSHQLPALERDVDQLRALDAEVLGISVDSHHANAAFARSLGLSFPLLSDWKRETSAAYGVLLPAGHSTRATFVVDKKGRIAHRDVSGDMGDIEEIPSHQEILRVLRGLEGG